MTTPELVPVLTKEEIKQKIIDIAGIISKDYAGKELLLIGILKGSFIFLSDLVRHLSIPVQIDFIRASSYGDKMSSSGTITLTESTQIDVRNKHLLLVEDIVDSGRTLAHVLKMLRTREPKSLKVCVLLDKKERREVPIVCDYVGFDVPDKYIFGYGIDIDEHFRHLPFIATADLSKYHKPAE